MIKAKKIFFSILKAVFLLLLTLTLILFLYTVFFYDPVPKEVKIENIPIIQREIFKILKKYKNKKIYIATNLLESMIYNQNPTRGEANDIYSSLEMGAAGLVLAAETAVGKYPKEATIFVKKMIKIFQKRYAV